MKVFTAKVVDGRLDMPEGTFEEGATVTLLVPEEEGFRLSPEDQAQLLAAMVQADRGEVVDGWQLLNSLPD